MDNKLKENLLTFFNIQKNIDILFNVIEKKTNYSLRVIEWFVTNYCKKHLVSYKINDKDFNVYKKYKDTLKSYTKDKFDPFKRSKTGCDKFLIKNKKTNKSIETTVCQLNFFKWIITNKIHEYIDKNIDKIKTEMKNESLEKNKDKTKSKVKIKINDKSLTKKFT